MRVGMRVSTGSTTGSCDTSLHASHTHTRVSALTERVVKPQLFCHANWLWPASSMKLILNILLKFWPKQCDVAAWIARPLVGMKPSMVVVYRPPANFSFSLLRPLIIGTANSSS